MGYTTEFEGCFKTNVPVDDQTALILKGLNKTRRMKRNVDPEYGVEGEFYFSFDNNFGQTKEPNIIDYNSPPRTQPGLWCNWELQEDKQTIQWDYGEKFYDYVEWIEYIIEKVLKPNGYVLNGTVYWYGEDHDDIGKIEIINNKVNTKKGQIIY